MAAKKIAKKASNGGKVPYVAPHGYRKVETGIAGFWKPTEPGQSVSGVVGHRVEGEYKGRKNVYFTFKVADDTSGPITSGDGEPVTVEGGLNVGVGGAVLQTFLAEHEGQAVHLFYTGMGTAKKGQNAPKLFDCYELEPNE